MKWKQAISRFGEKQSHGIQCNEYRIGRFMVQGREKHGVYFGDTRIGFFNAAADAKAKAESHMQTLSLVDIGDG